MIRLVRFNVYVRGAPYGLRAVALSPDNSPDEIEIFIADVVRQYSLYPVEHVSLIYPFDDFLAAFSEQEGLSREKAYEELLDIAFLEYLEEIEEEEELA